jgi:hypothetical protein
VSSLIAMERGARIFGDPMVLVFALDRGPGTHGQRPRAVPLRRSFVLANIERAGLKEGPSEDYGNEEHTTVAAFLPWRGS